MLELIILGTIIYIIADAISGAIHSSASSESEEKEIEKAISNGSNVTINIYKECTFNQISFNNSPIKDWSTGEFLTQKKFNYLDQGLKYSLGDRSIESLNQPSVLKMLDTGRHSKMGQLDLDTQMKNAMASIEKWNKE